MNKYFINSVEVEQDEFYAEFNAQAHAYFDENFNEILTEYSDNYDEEIRVGSYGFNVPELFNVLPEDMRDRITSELYEWYEEYCLDNLEFDEESRIRVNNQEFYFEIKEIDEE